MKKESHNNRRKIHTLVLVASAVTIALQSSAATLYTSRKPAPCNGTGLVQPWMAGAQDLDGNPRTTNGRVDIGAYQSGYPPLTTKLSIFRSGSNVVVQWRSGQPFNLVLESSSDLTAPESWTPVQGTTYTNGTNDFVTLPATNTVRFFRRR